MSTVSKSRPFTARSTAYPDWFVQEVANMRRKGDVEAEKSSPHRSVQAFGQQCLRQVYRSR